MASAAPLLRPARLQTRSANRAKTKGVGRFERGLGVAFIIAGFSVPALGVQSVEDLLWALAFLGALYGILVSRDRAASIARTALPLIVILALACASTIWSDDPMTSLRRGLALTTTAAVSLYFASRYDLKTFLRTLLYAMLILAVISLALVVAVPSIGTGDGSWTGCFGRKNGLGQGMLLGLITLTCTFGMFRGGRRFGCVLAACLFSVLLLGSRNGNSLVIAALFAVAFPIVYRMRNRGHNPRNLIVFSVALIAVVSVGVAVLGQETVLNALGKDTTLTGRGDVWDLATGAIQQRPWLGYGYKVFWEGAGAADPNGRTGATWATQAHNGALEVGLDLGAVGIIALAWLVVVTLRRTCAAFWNARGIVSAWPFLLCCSEVITNLTEATLVKYNDVSWMVFVTAFFFASRSLYVPGEDTT